MKDKVKARKQVLRFAGPILALRYCRAALRDEHNGFPFTAAMEWRRAAELSSCVSLLANRYWQQWERIMHVSRHIAEPIGVPVATNVTVLGQVATLRAAVASDVFVPRGHGSTGGITYSFTVRTISS
jgi:hypothetical protein